MIINIMFIARHEKCFQAIFIDFQMGLNVNNFSFQCHQSALISRLDTVNRLRNLSRKLEKRDWRINLIIFAELTQLINL